LPGLPKAKRVGHRPHKSQILLPLIGSYQQRPPGFSSLESQRPAAQAAQAARGRQPCVSQWSRRASQFSHLGIAGMTAPDLEVNCRLLRWRPGTARSDCSAVNPGIFIMFISNLFSADSALTIIETLSLASKKLPWFTGHPPLPGEALTRQYSEFSYSRVFNFAC